MLTPLSDPPPGPAPSAACGGGAANPTQNGRHLLAAADSLSRRPGLYPASPPPPRPRPPTRRGPAGPRVRPPADPGPLYPGPAEFGNPKGTKGSRDGAAGSHFVVSVVGLGHVHPERNGLGGGGGAAIREPGEDPPAGRASDRWVALSGHGGLRALPAAGSAGPVHRGASQFPVAGRACGAQCGPHVELHRGESC